ncbi:MAG: hypothetical protein K1X86_15855 [Ignavibacteria bacterium]|nr:hypothetical protein [Ignavibacteria bacterium]
MENSKALLFIVIGIVLLTAGFLYYVNSSPAPEQKKVVEQPPKEIPKKDSVKRKPKEVTQEKPKQNNTFEKDSYTAVIKVIKSSLSLNAIIKGKGESTEQVFNKDFTRQEKLRLSGDVYYNYLYKEEPSMTYFTVKRVSNRIYSVYFIIGANKRQSGEYQVNLDNGAIEADYDYLKQSVGF